MREASDRIVEVLDQLRRADTRPLIVFVALMDAIVRLGKFLTPEATTPALLRGAAKLALAMARDEERDPTPTQERILQ